MINYGMDTVEIKSKILDSQGNTAAQIKTKFAVQLDKGGQQKASGATDEQVGMGQSLPLMSKGKQPKLSLRKLLHSLVNRRGPDADLPSDFG